MYEGRIYAARIRDTIIFHDTLDTHFNYVHSSHFRSIRGTLEKNLWTKTLRIRVTLMNVKTGLMRQIGLCFTDLAAVTYTYAELAQLSYRLNKPIGPKHAGC